MRLTTPRVLPAGEGWTEEQREVAEPMLARGPVLNIFRTLLIHPPAAKAFLVWGGYILGRKSTLPPREREIVILRTGFLCRSGYEWTQHVPIGRRAGLTDDEIARIKLGGLVGPSPPRQRGLSTIGRLLWESVNIDGLRKAGLPE